MALASNSLIYAWGDNSFGQLGIGTQGGEFLPTPTLKDGDHNGLPDFWEIQHFGHRGVNPNADDDGDGLTNAQEFAAGTDPENPIPTVMALWMDKMDGRWTTPLRFHACLRFDTPSSTSLASGSWV